jgi:outer membrane biosynthesis protein TonB
MTPDRQWKRARLHFIITALIAAVLTGALFVPQNAFAAPTASPAAGATVAQMTQYVWAAQNQVRYDAGLPTGYARDSRLDKVAADWAYQQWKNGKMSHNPSYASQIPAGWQRAGENVASGYSYTQVVGAWKASQSHYANMVFDYTSVGIGYYEADGRRYWSVVFGKYPGTPVPTKPAAPSAPAPSPTPTTTPKPGTTPAPTPAPTTPPASGSYSAEPAAPAGTLIALASPSFEGSSSGWTGGAGIEGPTTGARGGKYDLKSVGGTVSQTVNVAPQAGEAYTATIWVKPGGSSKVSGSLRLTALGGSAEAATLNFSVSSGWMKVSVPLSVANAGHTALRIEVTLNSGDIRLDSASLVRTRNAPAAPAPAPSTTPTPTPTPTPSTGGGLLGGLLGTKPSTPAAPAAPPAPAPAPPAPPAPAPSTPAPAPAAPVPAPPAPQPASPLGGLLGGLLGL